MVTTPVPPSSAFTMPWDDNVSPHTHNGGIGSPLEANASLVCPYTKTITPLGLLFLRLGHTLTDHRTLFEFIHCHHVGDHKYILFLVVNGEPIVLSEESKLFPTDELVGKVMLLREAQDK